MSEMQERVAAAILLADSAWDANPGPHRWGETVARAAIDAIREQLTSMLLYELAHPSRKYHGMRFEHAIPMMIDAVLSPPLAHGEASEVRDDREG